MTATASVQSIFLALVVLLSSACATTRPLMEWRDEGLTGPYSNLVVIAAIERSTRRRVFEDMFVQELEGTNVDVTQSYTLMTTDVAISRESVEAAIKGKNIDAVLVTGSCFTVAEALHRLGFEELEETRMVRPAADLLGSMGKESS